MEHCNTYIRAWLLVSSTCERGFEQFLTGFRFLGRAEERREREKRACAKVNPHVRKANASVARASEDHVRRTANENGCMCFALIGEHARSFNVNATPYCSFIREKVQLALNTE